MSAATNTNCTTIFCLLTMLFYCSYFILTIIYYWIRCVYVSCDYIRRYRCRCRRHRRRRCHRHCCGFACCCCHNFSVRYSVSRSHARLHHISRLFFIWLSRIVFRSNYFVSLFLFWFFSFSLKLFFFACVCPLPLLLINCYHLKLSFTLSRKINCLCCVKICLFFCFFYCFMMKIWTNIKCDETKCAHLKIKRKISKAEEKKFEINFSFLHT